MSPADRINKLEQQIATLRHIIARQRLRIALYEVGLDIRQGKLAQPRKDHWTAAKWVS